MYEKNTQILTSLRYDDIVIHHISTGILLIFLGLSSVGLPYATIRALQGTLSLPSFAELQTASCLGALRARQPPSCLVLSSVCTTRLSASNIVCGG